MSVKPEKIAMVVTSFALLLVLLAVPTDLLLVQQQMAQVLPQTCMQGTLIWYTVVGSCGHSSAPVFDFLGCMWFVIEITTTPPASCLDRPKPGSVGTVQLTRFFPFCNAYNHIVAIHG